MLKSSYCYKEKEFSFLNENKQIIHGIFDVLCINEDKITIIDYKTDTLAKNSSDELLKNFIKVKCIIIKDYEANVSK